MANVSRGPSRSRGARWSKRGVVALVFVAGVAAAMAACLPGGNAVPAGDEADAGGLSLGDGSALGPRADVDLGDPFALDGLLPAHGPFSGKTRALVSGRGFSSDMRVFVGGVEVPREAVFASNVTRIAIEVPPGKPGPAEVRVKNTKTAEERALPAGFTYDAVVLRPDSGATSGGTRMAVFKTGEVGFVVAASLARNTKVATPPGNTTPAGAVAKGSLLNLTVRLAPGPAVLSYLKPAGTVTAAMLDRSQSVLFNASSTLAL